MIPLLARGAFHFVHKRRKRLPLSPTKPQWMHANTASTISQSPFTASATSSALLSSLLERWQTSVLPLTHVPPSSSSHREICPSSTSSCSRRSPQGQTFPSTSSARPKRRATHIEQHMILPAHTPFSFSAQVSLTATEQHRQFLLMHCAEQRRAAVSSFPVMQRQNAPRAVWRRMP